MHIIIIETDQRQMGHSDKVREVIFEKLINNECNYRTNLMKMYLFIYFAELRKSWVIKLALLAITSGTPVPCESNRRRLSFSLYRSLSHTHTSTQA